VNVRRTSLRAFSWSFQSITDAHGNVDQSFSAVDAPQAGRSKLIGECTGDSFGKKNRPSLHDSQPAAAPPPIPDRRPPPPASPNMSG